MTPEVKAMILGELRRTGCGHHFGQSEIKNLGAAAHLSHFIL
jgi:hypothetical protein